MPEGLVIKAKGGFFFVFHGETARRCTIRGRLKRGGSILVGDRVEFRLVSGDRGVIEQVLPRRNALARPPIANVDQALVVMAFREPDPSLNLLDRILVHCEAAGIGAVICLNKADLAAPEELRSSWIRVYREAGYSIRIASAVTGLGVNELREALRRRITVLAGPSGAGKSSLLNAVQPGLTLRTGGISRKLKRGRHVTRHVELLPLDGGGWVADTPGFSVLRLDGIASAELTGLFPEFRRRAGPCRFTDCRHYREPDCGVRAAVAAGEVARSRYAHYLVFLRETRVWEERRKK